MSTLRRIYLPPFHPTMQLTAHFSNITVLSLPIIGGNKNVQPSERVWCLPNSTHITNRFHTCGSQLACNERSNSDFLCCTLYRGQYRVCEYPFLSYIQTYIHTFKQAYLQLEWEYIYRKYIRNKSIYVRILRSEIDERIYFVAGFLYEHHPHCWAQ